MNSIFSTLTDDEKAKMLFVGMGDQESVASNQVWCDLSTHFPVAINPVTNNNKIGDVSQGQWQKTAVMVKSANGWNLHQICSSSLTMTEVETAMKEALAAAPASEGDVVIETCPAPTPAPPATPATPAPPAEPAGITRCQSGADDILGTRKAFAVQVCNFFGADCYMNHPAVSSANCGTEALKIPNGVCKAYPIFEFEDNGVRSGDSAVEQMSVYSDTDCSVSSSSSVYKWSGGCVSVQCDLGDGAFAGPAMTAADQSSSNRKTGVTDTGTQTFRANTLAGFGSVGGLKTAYLVRTGSSVATTKVDSSSNSNSVSYNVGNLPGTSDGNWNYGYPTCPSNGNALTSAKATGITAANLRMCGASGDYVYYNVINLLQDEDLYGSLGGDTSVNMGDVSFLGHDAKYYSTSSAAGKAHTFKIHSSSGSSASVLMTSETVTPSGTAAGWAASDNKKAGTGRTYGVVFYCDDYARIDLTTCAEANRKMFYVADFNPDVQFGATAGAITGGGNGGNAATPAPASGATPAPAGGATPAPATTAAPTDTETSSVGWMGPSAFTLGVVVMTAMITK